MGGTGASNGIPLEQVSAVLKSQYRAGLAMLREAIELCPDGEWESRQHVNAFWQIAYHCLFFTHLYLQPTPEDFQPWPGHQGEVQHDDGIAGPADPDSELPLLPSAYSKAEVLEYVEYLSDRIDPFVDALELASPESGFYWYKVSKLEHQVINIRHLHHHVAQLADRVRAATGSGVRWVGRGG